MLRLQYERGSEKLSSLHDKKYTKPANSLHRLGKELPFQVCHGHHINFYSNLCSEIFGVSEEQAPELDLTEDSENGG